MAVRPPGLVVLPYAGRFLLLVVEFHYGQPGDSSNGALTHVLYIDARDSANPRSKLVIHPKG